MRCVAALAAMDFVSRRGLRGARLRRSPGGPCARACRRSKARRARPALGAEATIERDARGIPVITAASRADLAYATGYAHAQDRFFQMDLSRRLAAGELSELFGAVALKQDRRTRRFGFRAVARRVIEAAPEGERAIIEAYARGVNAGLASLRARPWEYLLLRAQPRAWLPEDSVLVVHSMWWQLQYGTLRDEIDRRRLERAAAARSDAAAAHELIAFVYAGHSEWDTPNYSAESPCVQAACTDSARVLTQSFPGAAALRRRRGRAGGARPRRPAATTGRWPAFTRGPASR